MAAYAKVEDSETITLSMKSFNEFTKNTQIYQILEHIKSELENINFNLGNISNSLQPKDKD